MKCKKCHSENLIIIGPKRKLVCNDCLAYQKFLTVADAKTFLQIKEEESFKLTIPED